MSTEPQRFRIAAFDGEPEKTCPPDILEFFESLVRRTFAERLSGNELEAAVRKVTEAKPEVVRLHRMNPDDVPGWITSAAFDTCVQHAMAAQDRWDFPSPEMIRVALSAALPAHTAQVAEELLAILNDAPSVEVGAFRLAAKLGQMRGGQ